MRVCLSGFKGIQVPDLMIQCASLQESDYLKLSERPSTISIIGLYVLPNTQSSQRIDREIFAPTAPVAK